MFVLNRFVLHREMELSGLQLLYSIGMSGLFSAVYLPVYYWLGAKGAQLTSFLAIFFAAALTAGLWGTVEVIGDGSSLSLSRTTVGIGMPVTGLVLLCVSYFISLSIFRRKDMAD